MTVLVVAVVLVAMLCLLDLLLTLGVIRRLREHTSQLEKILQGTAASALPTIGDKVGAFTATTVDGASVSDSVFTRETLVAFFSPTCAPCKEKLPGFTDFARTWASDQRQILSVVTGPVEETTDMVESLRPLGMAIVDGVDGPVSQAFKANSTPTFCLLDDTGTIVAADFDFQSMPTLVEA